MLKQLLNQKPKNSIAISALAAYRLAYLVNKERGPFDLAERARSAVYHTYGADSWQFEGITCVLCVSFWSALVVQFLPQTIVRGLATAGVVLVAKEAVDAFIEP